MRRLAGVSLFLWGGLAVSAAPEVRVLQQGLGDYSGVRDTFVSAEDWADPPQCLVNYGRNPALTLVRDGRASPLIHFDLSGIPPNATIFSATLSLYNTTGSSSSPPRRIQAFRLLRDWDEGNQVDSPLDAPGKRGATGVDAFAYFPGEGTNSPWGAVGLLADADYGGVAIGNDVRGPGWYDWDVTADLQGWVRQPGANHGVVLRDASGWRPFDDDGRAFASSDSEDAALRPRLTIELDADTPYADAGTDLQKLDWTGEPVTLDGSGSGDRPGGNDATLRFEWRVVHEAFGSKLGGALLSGDRVASVSLDRAGEWEIELTVTNDLGRSARDRVHVQLLSVGATDHPRIFLTPARLVTLRARAEPTNPRWLQLLNAAEPADGDMIAQALVYQVTGDSGYADKAITTALALAVEPGSQATLPGELALVYDWCHDRLTKPQRAFLRDSLGTWAIDHAVNPGDDQSGWGNYWPRYGYSYALMGLATLGEDARAPGWLEEFRHRRYRDHDQPALDRIAAGGGWPEGTAYDPIANLSRIEALEAWRSATGEDLFESTAWYKERLGYLLLNSQPGVAEDPFGYQFHPYNSTGDAERNRGSLMGYKRIMALLLVQRFRDEPLARQLQAYLAAAATDDTESHFPEREFLWFDPGARAAPPRMLTHYAAGTGTLLARSAWPRGAADDDPRATYLTFQCGDHFSYHQHYDQNAFTLFKGGDLVVDSGVYSGNGLGHHDIDYYVRTIAHNTLVVHNSREDFSAARPDASSNDGGQRTYSPSTRSPSSVEEWDQAAVYHDVCDMLNFEDGSRYTYARGDATKAYNNPSYNQSQDTELEFNEAKVSRFQRELVYLRPEPAAPHEYVVLFDRVGVTRESFSGPSTKLLFHFRQEPDVRGEAIQISPGETLYEGAPPAVATSGDGKVFLQFLLPSARNLRKVGGPGEKAFWVFDQNYDWQWDADEAPPRPTTEFDPEPYGEWRLELEPADSALEHGFLTVLHPTDAKVLRMPPVYLIEGERLTGAHIADRGLNHVVLFSTATDGAAPEGRLQYRFRPTAPSRHVIADLAPGARYSRTILPARDGIAIRLLPDPQGAEVVGPEGVLTFDVEVIPAP